MSRSKLEFHGSFQFSVKKACLKEFLKMHFGLVFSLKCRGYSFCYFVMTRVFIFANIFGSYYCVTCSITIGSLMLASFFQHPQLFLQRFGVFFMLISNLRSFMYMKKNINDFMGKVEMDSSDRGSTQKKKKRH